ncbi:MAG: ABC transporter permease [Lachnospiraceae bacterium]|nr:ABC transporter permease [Lachnospiraceae bacterium]
MNRDLVFKLAVNDLKKRYAGSYLGLIWALVGPVVTVFMYWFVFERFFGQKAQLVSKGIDLPYVLYLTSGLVPWFFFSECMTQGAVALTEYTFLVKQVVFRIEMLPLVKCLAACFTHIFFIILMLVVSVLYGIFPGIFILQLFYYSFCTFMLSLGFAYLCSAITVFFRDLSQIINVLLQLGMWATPILWNINILGDKGILSFILKCNPLYYIVKGFRESVSGSTVFYEDVKGTLYFWCFTILLYIAGRFVFGRLKPRFADVM